MTVTGPLDETALGKAWPKIEGFIGDALERDGWKITLEDFLDQAAQGLFGIYAISDDETGEWLGAVACEVNSYPRRDVFNIAYCGGTALYRWAGMLGALEAEAVRLGCDTVQITGRPGWGRIFPDYRETNRVFERKVVVEK